MQHPIHTLLRAAVVLSTLLLGARTQAYAGPILAFGAGHPYTPETIYLVDLGGNATPLHSFAFIHAPNSFTFDVDNETLVMHDTNPDAVVRFDLGAFAFLGALHQGAPLGEVFCVRPFGTGDYLVADSVFTAPNGFETSVRLVRADGSGVATLFTTSAWDAQIRALAEDLATGEILAGLLTIGPPGTAPSLIRIAPDTGTFTVLDPTPRSITALVQDHRDGAVIYGAYDGGIWRRAPNGAVETLIPATHPSNITASSLAFDRAEENGVLVAGGSGRLARIAFTPGGPASVVAVHAPGASLGLPAVKDIAFVGERNIASHRAGQLRWQFELSFPGEGGGIYALALSLTGFTPGIPLGNRTIPLVPDAVFFASLNGSLAPILQDNVGVLDAQGRATVTLDLSVFGGVDPNARVWVAAATIDGAAPFGLRTISKPSILVLR